MNDLSFLETIKIADVRGPIQSYIYVLWDMTKNEPFYVGKTSNPKQRFLHHLNEITPSKKKQRIDEILSKDPNGVELRVIFVTDNFQEDMYENYFIRCLSREYQLVNKYIVDGQVAIEDVRDKMKHGAVRRNRKNTLKRHEIRR